MDDRSIYEFIEKIPTNFDIHDPTFLKLYFEFIIRLLSIPILDRFTDLVVRKFIHIVQNIVCNHVIDEMKCLEYLPRILEKLQNIMKLRTNNEFLALVGTNPKATAHIWLYATEIFLKLITHAMSTFHKIDQIEKTDESQQDALVFQRKVIQQMIDTIESVLSNSGKGAGIPIYLFALE